MPLVQARLFDAWPRPHRPEVRQAHCAGIIIQVCLSACDHGRPHRAPDRAAAAASNAPGVRTTTMHAALHASVQLQVVTSPPPAPAAVGLVGPRCMGLPNPIRPGPAPHAAGAPAQASAPPSPRSPCALLLSSSWLDSGSAAADSVGSASRRAVQAQPPRPSPQPSPALSSMAAPPEAFCVDLFLAADGSKYYGTLKNGVPDGLGTCIWPDGNQYDGEWRAGQVRARGRPAPAPAPAPAAAAAAAAARPRR
jgi:hypothetical protein